VFLFSHESFKYRHRLWAGTHVGDESLSTDYYVKHVYS